jgi:NO-binding membrane sensor protein with MHYT domain
MAKSSKSNKSSQNSDVSNGGIMGSGIFAHFGTMINCKAEDTSMYCTFMKFFNVLIAIVAICGIIYLIYLFLIKK